MNYKLLFPTYRNRYLFIMQNLEKFSRERHFERALNLGAGEGDYDAMIASYCSQLVSCDINEQDINYARTLNKEVANLQYRVEDALNLSFEDNTFNLIISVEVIEHVGQPERMIEEIQRVLKPDGLAMITFPSLDFPFTYDPINRLLSIFTHTNISQGAYAFGHDYLVSKTDFRIWSKKNHLAIVQERNLSGYLIGLLEMYWTGVIQHIFKVNATNLPGQKEKRIALRPSSKGPFLTRLTDLIIKLDDALFRRARNSIGMGFVIQKKE